MNFDFSDDQKMLRDQAQQFLAEKCPPKAVRAVLEGAQGYDASLWKGDCRDGLAGHGDPRSLWRARARLSRALRGGRGAGPRAGAGAVLVDRSICSPRRCWPPAARSRRQTLLPKVAEGALIGTLRPHRRPGRGDAEIDPHHVPRRQAERQRRLAVVDGMDADYAVVLARTSDEPGERGLGLALVDLKARRASRARRRIPIDPSRKHAEITFNDAPAEALGKPGEGWAISERVLDRAAIMTAFEQVGGADVCLEQAKDYAMDRYAFGRPIASYQAIKHKLADMYVNNELARSNAYYGAWALSTDAPELPLAAAAARVSATQAFDYAAKENIQTHGGVGFTWEFDCHLLLQALARTGAVASVRSAAGRTSSSPRSNARTPPDAHWNSRKRPMDFEDTTEEAQFRSRSAQMARCQCAQGRGRRWRRTRPNAPTRASSPPAGPGRPRRPRPAMPASPGPRRSAAMAARRSSR